MQAEYSRLTMPDGFSFDWRLSEAGRNKKSAVAITSHPIIIIISMLKPPDARSPLGPGTTSVQQTTYARLGQLGQIVINLPLQSVTAACISNSLPKHATFTPSMVVFRSALLEDCSMSQIQPLSHCTVPVQWRLCYFGPFNRYLLTCLFASFPREP